MMRRLHKLTLLPVVLLGSWSVAQASETVKIQVADFSGKPPFSRKNVEVPVEDVAKLEALNTDGQPIDYVTVRTVNMRGKPPYRRQVETLPVYDVAKLEAVQNNVRTGRPPFKR